MSSSPTPPSFPLLQLPTEVRLAIYQYLIPNLPVYNQPLLRKGLVCLRDDREQCCPALLRVNHQIYQEMIAEWYGGTKYEITIDSQYIIFVGRPMAPFVPMPSTIRFVENLQISVSLQRGPQHVDDYTKMENLLNFQDRLVTLARSLGGKHGKLKRLHLKITINIPLLMSLSKTPAEITDLLSWNLGPLGHHIRGLSEMRWELTEQTFGIQNEYFQRTYLRMKSIMQLYLDTMRQHMLSSCSPNDIVQNLHRSVFNREFY